MHIQDLFRLFCFGRLPADAFLAALRVVFLDVGLEEDFLLVASDFWRAGDFFLVSALGFDGDEDIGLSDFSWRVGCDLDDFPERLRGTEAAVKSKNLLALSMRSTLTGSDDPILNFWPDFLAEIVDVSLKNR